MSFPRYERYKASGVEWLGEVPEHWEVNRLRFMLQLVTDPAAGKQNTVALENIESWTGRLIVTETPFEGDGVAFEAGDILFGKLRPYLAKAYLADRPGAAVGDFHVLRPRSSVDGMYAQLLFINKSLIQIIDGSTIGAKMPRAAWQFIADLVLPKPPLSEQIKIAEFVQTETAKIDELLEEQGRLIELLKEKRQAVISRAVTYGLNPNVLLYDSSSLGMRPIPKHWTASKLRYFAPFRRGHDLTQDEHEEGEYPVITSGGVTGKHSSFMQKGPGVVTGRYGSTGRLFYVEENFWPHNTSLYVQSFFGNIPRYVWYSLHTVNFAMHSAKSAVPGIDRNDLDVLPVAVPPIEEQAQIVAYLDIQMKTFDSSVREAVQITELLQERRSALISAAVTGKIDVRNYAKQSTEEAA